MNMSKDIKESNKVVIDVVKIVETDVKIEVLYMEYQVVMFRETQKRYLK